MFGRIARASNLKMKAIKYLGGKCENCGYNKHPKALEFHHKDPNEKDYGIGSKKNVNFESLKLELDKCILLCANCHREEHDRIWREANSVNWDLFNELINYDEWPNLLKITYQERFGLKPTCIDCNKELSRKSLGKRCLNCIHQGDHHTKAKYPAKEILKKLLWEKPTVEIAKELGVSDKAVEKRCKKLGIEKPPPGYWTRKKYGKI